MLLLSLAQGSAGEQRMKRSVPISSADFLKLNGGSLMLSWYKSTNDHHTINIQDDEIYHVECMRDAHDEVKMKGGMQRVAERASI